MAVYMVYGKPGAGKSAWVVHNIVKKELIQKKRKVITNLSLNTKYLTEILDVDKELIRIIHSEKGDFSDTFLEAKDYHDDWRNDKGQAPVIIVDEAHFSLNKQRKKTEVLEIEEFFSTHRQAGYDIYLITQDYGRIPNDILGFVETFYQVKKQRALGKGSFSVYVRDSDKFKSIIGEKTGRYPKDVFKCYKSHLLSNNNIEEDNDVAGIKLIWLTWPFLATYAMIALLIYGFTIGGLSLNPFAFLGEEQEKQELKEDIDLKNLEYVSLNEDKKIIPANEISPVQSLIDEKEIDFEPIEIKEEVIEEVRYLNQFHPLDNKLFQIRSWINNTAFITLYDKETKEKISVIKSIDLEKMGYVVEQYSSCSMKLTYENINFFIDCSNIKIEEDSASDKILNNVPVIN